jgi:hypothetical protein
MPSLLSPFLSVWILACTQFLYAQPANVVYTQWKEVQNENDIYLYERWITVGNNIQVRQQKGELQVSATKEKVVRVLTDIENNKVWMHRIKESYFIQQNAPNDFYTYTIFSLPWPLRNRDLISHYQLYSPNPHLTTIKIESSDELLPEQKGIERLKKYFASWEIIETDKKSCRLTFIAQTNIPSEYPHFIQDPVVRNEFMNNLKNLKQLLSTSP